MPRYNLILIVSDALRADHLGCYGYQRDTSRNIDRLAARGTVFTQASSQSSTTGAAHAAIMTARLPTDLGILSNHGLIPGSDKTLAEILHSADYQTAAFVSNAVLHAKGLRGIERGFDLYDCNLSSLEPNRPVAFRRSAETSAAAEEWLRGAREPFFLWVHFIEPHGPYLASDAEQVRRIEKDTLAAAQRKRLAPLGGDAGPNGIPRYQALPGVTRVSSYIARYDACISDMDRAVGELLAALERKGVTERTVIAFTSDHGEALGEHGYYFQHPHDLTEEVLHVPLILRLPGCAAPGKVPSVVQAVDLMPTLLEALGLRARIPAGARGSPLFAPTVARVGARDVLSAVWDFRRSLPLGSVRRGGWKLIASQPPGERRLFYLPTDPDELRNLASQEGEQVETLYAALEPHLRKAKPPAAPELDAGTREALRRLGYLN